MPFVVKRWHPALLQLRPPLQGPQSQQKNRS
jgi:hypothetical protein